MGTFFLLCAAVGGTILVLQVALSLLGFGGDVIGEVADGGDLPDAPDSAEGGDRGGLSELGRKLTFQTIISFVTFFGVAGLSARGAGWSGGASLATAVGVGVAAMVALAYAFGLLRKLQGDGSLRLADAVGIKGRVYLRVPGLEGGVGKVTLPVQGRTEEIRALTTGPELRAGEAVVVTRIVDPRTVEVVAEAAYLEKAPSLADY